LIYAVVCGAPIGPASIQRNPRSSGNCELRYAISHDFWIRNNC
jgi:hypothetical protein